MKRIQTLPKITFFDDDEYRPTLDLVNILVLLGAFFVSIEVKVVAALTVYDLITLAAAFLIVIGPKKLRILPASFLVPVYFFLLFALISTFRATHPVEALTQIMQFVFIFFVQLPVILTVVRSKFMLRTCFILFLIGSLIGVTWAMVNTVDGGGGRLASFYSDNPNRLGYPTAYLTPILVYMLLDSWRRKRSFIPLLLAMPVIYLFVWALAASASRAATAGTLIAILTFFVFRDGISLNLKIPIRIVGTVVIIGMIGYLLYQSEYFPDTLRERTELTFEGETSLVDDRRLLAIAGLQAFYQSPFIGVGLDNFQFVAREYVLNVTEQAPHNLWIQFLAQIGLFGTIAFFTLIVQWFLLLYKAQKVVPDSSRQRLLWAFIASMAAVMIIYMFNPIMNQRQYWMLFGCGIVVAIDVISTHAKTVSEAQDQLNLLSPEAASQ